MKRVICFDLDDTLTKEIDFLKSGYRAVAESVEKRFGLDAEDVYEKLLNWFQMGKNAFQMLNETYALDSSVEDYLSVYRFHQPSLVLDDEVREVLSRLKDDGVLLGIVSDGREKTQMNKVKALGLTEWIDEDCIVINSDARYFKPNPYGYDRLMSVLYEKTGEQKLDFTYVGDNLEKDFICPNQKGWMTVCLKNDGRNIRPQDFASATGDAVPKKVVGSLTELI